MSQPRLNLVTGGAGFIGRHLVQLLRARGERVRVLDRVIRPAFEDVDVETIVGDIRDIQVVRRAVADCERVYHLAANPQLWTLKKGQFGQVNSLGTRNVLQCSIDARVERILHCSTESILTRARQDRPITEDQQVPIDDVIGPYCRSKWRAEALAFALAKHGAPIVIVNPTLPIGPGDWGRSPPTQMILDCAQGKRAVYLDAELNLIDVRDIAAGMIAAMDHGQCGRRYIFGAENWTIRQLFGHVAGKLGVTGPRLAIPYPMALTAAMVSEWIADVFTQRIPAATTTGVRLTRRAMHFDTRRTWTELGLQPRPVHESIAAALTWMREIHWLS